MNNQHLTKLSTKSGLYAGLFIFMNNKQWENRKFSEVDIKEIIENYDVPKSIAKVMAVRGLIHKDKIRSFFYPNTHKLHDPFLMHDMSKAVNRIINQIKNKK